MAVNPPTGAWLAIKFANLIDPALQTDLYGEKPWLFSPMLCAMNIVNVKPNSTPLPSGKPEISHPSSQQPDAEKLLCKWEWVGEKDLAEDNSLLLPPIPSPTLSDGFIEDDDNHSNTSSELFASDDIANRRKYFQKKEHRMKPVFKPDHVYNFEVCV